MSQYATAAPPAHGAPKGTLHAAYCKLFSLHEVEQDLAVKLFGAAVLFGFFITFGIWQTETATTIDGIHWGTSLCWPFFQECQNYIFLRSLPLGYSQTLVYMGLFGLIVLCAYALIVNRFALAHGCMLLLFLWKIYATAINYNFAGNYDYYHTAFAVVFLFLPHKRFFASLAIVLFYFLSTATKIHPSWTLGAYFSAMQTGLPLFPNEMIPLATNLVIFFEMVGAWFLFSRHKFLQRSVFIFFVIFHLYSGILVGYRYPSIVLPSLLILFGPLFRPFPQVPLDRSSLLGWTLCVFLCVTQSISHFIPGDEKLTMEGNRYGLYMFEANHQCVIEVGEHDRILDSVVSSSARARCDPYAYWFRYATRYCSNQPRVLSFRIIHSINGGPFYRIVDEPDLCALEYLPFAKNDWIKTADQAPVVARPVKNFYW